MTASTSKPQAIYGIIGFPVEHSLSPFMHNTAFKELGVNAIYKFFPLKEDELDSFFADLKKSDSPIFGLNVTVPYKERVIPYLDNITPFAKRAMSVNTIVISKDRKLTGHNTDGPGFLAHLTELGVDIRNKRIAILGAGGTTRAILTAICLLPEQPEVVRLYNRTVSKAHELVADLEQRISMGRVEVVSSIDALNIELADILINTTSVGMKKEDPCLVDPEEIHEDMLVYDVIYVPEETKLLKLARQKGAKVANGLEMLFYQGILAFQHWANLQLDDTIKKKMRQSLKEKRVI